MPFDSTLPKAGTKMRSGEIRDNLNALKDQMDGTLVGPPGPPGDKGDKGDKGDGGDKGDKGDKGDTGEVSNQQLNDAVATTARNPSSIGPYGGDFSDPPTQQEMRDYRDYVETLRVAMTR